MATKEMTITDATNVLEKIKKEMMERRQVAAQNKTNKQLEEMNYNLKKLNSKQKDAAKADSNVNIKFPSVADIVNGFTRSSPIFGRGYSNWMKDTISIGHEGNSELQKIASHLDILSSANDDKKGDLNTEYLDMISSQLGAANNDSLKRMDDQGNSLSGINGALTRIESTLHDTNKSIDSATKIQHNQLVRLVGIENKIGAVGGHIVNSLKRIFDSQEKTREKNEFKQAEESKEVGGNPKAGSVIPTKPPGESDSSTSNGIMGAIAAMLGLNTLKAFLGKPFMAVGRVFGKFFGMFSKLGKGTEALLGPFGKALKFLKVGPLALIGSAIDFGKGFFNASEILGKEKVTVVDRMRAGTVELIGGIGDLADWIAKIFGFDTSLGKTFRETWLKISEAPARWSQSIVDWFKNDLFGGIDRNTALTDMPGKIVDNLQSELIKLVDWISKGFSDFVDDGMKVVDKIMADIKSGFAEKVKKPFINMVNSITNAMFDIIDKFVEIIPDALGGAAARSKMEDARKSMLIDVDPEKQPGATPAASSDDMKSPNPANLTPLPDQKPADDGSVSNVTGKTDLGWSYAQQPAPSPTIQAASPVAGRAVSNIDQMKSAYAAQAPQVIMPVQQNVDNSNKVNNTTNIHSSSLEPTNVTDKSRILWDY